MRRKINAKSLSFVATLAMALFLGISAAFAGGTKEEAKAMSEKAAAFLKANGPEKAFAAFNQGTDGFKDRDLYVFVYDNDGVCKSIGSNPAMVGKNLIDMKDSDGIPLIREFLKVKETGWVDYKWRNPQTQEILPKTSYIVRVGDLIVGVGAYLSK